MTKLNKSVPKGHKVEEEGYTLTRKGIMGAELMTRLDLSFSQLEAIMDWHQAELKDLAQEIAQTAQHIYNEHDYEDWRDAYEGAIKRTLAKYLKEGE